MTPRARRRWLIALPVLLLPTLLIAAMLWYFGSGKAIRDLRATWAEHLPGELAVDSVQLEGVGTLSAEGIAWHDQGQQHLSVEKITVSGNPLAGEMSELHIDQPRINLTRAGRSSWKVLPWQCRK